MTEQATSPLPATMSPTPDKSKTLDPSQKTLDFPDAIRQVKEGKKVHKLEWENRDYYGFLNGNILSLHKPDNKNYQWVISEGDLMGNDYIVI